MNTNLVAKQATRMCTWMTFYSDNISFRYSGGDTRVWWFVQDNRLRYGSIFRDIYCHPDSRWNKMLVRKINLLSCSRYLSRCGNIIWIRSFIELNSELINYAVHYWKQKTVHKCGSLYVVTWFYKIRTNILLVIVLPWSGYRVCRSELKIYISILW